MCRLQGNSTRSLLILASALATVAFGVALVLGWEPGIRGEWVWRRNALLVRLWLALALGLGLTGLSAFLCRARAWDRMRPGARCLSLAAIVCLTFALQVALLNSVGLPWVTPGAYIVSPNATTYFAVSLDVTGVSGWIADYPAVLQQLPYHAATHPPGFVLFFLAVRRAVAAFAPTSSSTFADLATNYSDLFGYGLAPSDAAAAIAGALAISLVGALSLLPVYFLGRLLMGAHSAICATCLAAAVPGLLLLAASPDLIVAALTVAALYAAYAGWRRRSIWLGFLAGVMVGIGLFCSLAFGLVVAWGVVWALTGAAKSTDPSGYVRRALAAGAIAAGGLAAFYLLLYVLVGYRPVAVARGALLAHRAVAATESVRSYWKWVLMNPLECALFAGLPLSAAALWARRAIAAPRLARLRVFLASWAIIFVLLDLSGTVRGEVGRIWLFLLWPAALAAGGWATSRPGRETAVPLLVLLQVVQALLMKSYLTIYSIL